MSTVAVLGTGIMGFPMARNLAAAGFDVRAWNRTREKAEPLAEHGVTVADTPAEAANGADVLVTILSDTDAVVAAVEGVRDVPAWAQMSTVGLEGTERLSALAAERGMGYVDAPVVGTRQPAEQAQLLVLASGDPALRERVDPVFDAVGRATRWLGDEPGAATRFKLVLNHWVLGLVENLGETIALAEGLGIDPRAFLEAIEGAPMDSPYAQTKGSAIVEGTLDEPAFALRLARKDVGLVMEAAREAGVSVPVMEAAWKQFGRAEELGHGDKDMAATVHAARPSGAPSSA
jgi:3-hydroxyisobutyrate dehydrogenase